MSLALFFLTSGACPEENFSPIDMQLDTAGRKLYVAGLTARELRSYDLNDLSKHTSFQVSLPLKAFCMSDQYLLLACSHSEGFLTVLEKNTLDEVAHIPVGHGACDVEISPDQSTAYVANQFSDDISVIDLKEFREVSRIKVLRQPKQLSLAADGHTLFVANFLPVGRADEDVVTSFVSVIDLQAGQCMKHIPLANGSNALRGMCLSPDDRYLLITHNLGRFQVPTTQLEQGWMNTSALSMIDAQSMEYAATILLDEPDRGAAGSWGLSCSQEHVFVAHSGTHDFSTIDYHALTERLLTHPDPNNLAYDLGFLSGIRERTAIDGNGPRALAFSQGKLFVSTFFSDRMHVFTRENSRWVAEEEIPLSDTGHRDKIRLGEQYFNDATFCFQSWQSCNGCHPDNARIDALNWDLLNDGMGNPKNCKSLLLSHLTPPSMITGIRPDAESAVRAGFAHIQFMNVDDSIAQAVDAYLMSLEPIPSPFLLNGELSPLAREGKRVFEKSACGECHPGPYYTDQRSHEMGARGSFDRTNSWDTPTLVECWRTAPYLHDGRCATMEEVFSRERHGLEDSLTEAEIKQLVAYVLSL